MIESSDIVDLGFGQRVNDAAVLCHDVFYGSIDLDSVMTPNVGLGNRL